MSHPCQYNVYRRAKGETKKFMMASFADLPDAVNFAYDCSVGRYGHLYTITMIVLDIDRKVFRKYNRGNQV